jgi:hypothetical protein
MGYQTDILDIPAALEIVFKASPCALIAPLIFPLTKETKNYEKNNIEPLTLSILHYEKRSKALSY